MMIDEFTLIKCIGKGAFGEVFISSKQGTSKLFAIKKVPKSKADSPAIKKYFINEITILREISHPYIIHFETIKHTIHNYYIITEFCNGGDLLSCLKKYKSLYYLPFSEEIVQHLMRQIVSAMKYLHQKRIIHRDLKLENILVIFENDNDKAKMNMMKAKVKIIDFGFATHLGASNLRYSTLGSPINMDPLLLKKLVHKNKGNMNLIGYDEKADIWSLGTVCYELLIGKEVFNAQTMIDLIRNVENGNYHVPTNLSKEVVSFLNGMLQYSAKNRLSSEDLSKHPFLIKNVKDFKKLDLRKVSNKVDMQGLNINIKRNQSIWAIFNQEDEKALIDIPGKIYEESPVQLDEILGIKDLVNNNNKTNEKNPFNKPINININNKMKNNVTNNQVNVVKNKEQNIDYNLLQKQQKMYHEMNLKNDKYKRDANYVYNNPYGFGGTTNNNIHYVNVQPKYYTANVNGPNNNYNSKQVQKDTTKINVPINNNVNIITKPIQQNNLIQYPQYQQNPYTTQSPLYQINIQKIKTAPVKSQQDLINQGFYQTSPNQNTNKQNIQVKQVNMPQNNYPNNTNQVQQVQQIQNIQVQNPVINPEDKTKHKSPKDKLNSSKISAITNITTKTVQMPKGARMPKSYYDNYSYHTQNQQPQIIHKNTHSKSPIKQTYLNNDKKHIYQKQMTYTERPKDINNYNNQNIKTNNNVVKNQGAYGFHSVKVIQKKDKNEQPNNKTTTVTINNKAKKPAESYIIKYENKDFPDNNYSPQVKITKIESTKDVHPGPSDFNHSHKKSADYLVNNNNNINTNKEENNIVFNNNNNQKKEHKKTIRNDSFPMPESGDEEEEKEKTNESKNEDDSENLDDLIDFKLGDEICPPEDELINNDIKDDNDKEKEDNFEMTMKKKIMERTVERPTLGVPPPGTDPKDNFEFDEDDDLNNGVFQTNKNNIFNNNDDNNFEI